jgi:HEPN domain-containing protein
MTRNDETLPDREAVAQWLLLAQSDFDYAVLGASAGHIHPNLVCFHLQQCVEKSLKAVLAHRGLVVPRTHDLADLAARLTEEKPALPAKTLFSMLTPFGSAERYPGAGDIPAPKEVAEFQASALQVLIWAKAAVG